MGYHNIIIMKHDHDSPFKIFEEFKEFIDSLASNNKLMAMQELSDLYGAIETQANLLNVTMSDLKTMSDVTKKVFKTGYRVSNSDKTHDKHFKIVAIDYDECHILQNDAIIEIINGSVIVDSVMTEKICFVNKDKRVLSNDNNTILKIFEV